MGTARCYNALLQETFLLCILPRWHTQSGNLRFRSLSTISKKEKETLPPTKEVLLRRASPVVALPRQVSSGRVFPWGELCLVPLCHFKLRLSLHRYSKL